MLSAGSRRILRMQILTVKKGATLVSRVDPTIPAFDALTHH